MSLVFSFILSFLLVPKAFSEIHYSLNVQGRTHPSSTNLIGVVAYDDLIWGEHSKENPAYGYYRVGAIGGGAPNYGAFIQVSPIAPIIFEVQQGYTHRFANISTLNCETIQCKGMVTRTDYSIKAVGAINHIFILASANWREIQTPAAATAVGLEFEMFAVPAGYHRYFESAAVVGYKLEENKAIGILFTNGEILGQNLKNSSVYGIYRFPWSEFNFSAGVGRYSSNQPDQDGFSGILSISRSWGEKLSLF